ncbi:MAG: hypothetical protein Q8O92_01700 [Candidatus Latescibacter sp.]|nr:hypothetical protein [Candidatus Latescibacter sp.]
MSRKQSKAKCSYCGAEYAKNGMTKHLAACEKRQEAIRKAEQGNTRSETLYYVRVQDAGPGIYWLELEMRGPATLKDLDFYLRTIWLECCGHMSQFSVGGWSGEEIPMSRKVDAVFKLEHELTHIYDFGTSSETLIKVIDTRVGKPLTKHPIELMARNLTPEEECIECGKPATRLCLECLIEEDVWGVLCEEHIKKHPHKENYGKPMRIVNSPRLGLCGYDGPAKPPY